MLDLYHRTTPEAAQAILADNRFVTRENRAVASCSTHIDGQGKGYGVAVVHLRIRESLGEIDYESPAGNSTSASHWIWRTSWRPSPSRERIPPRVNTAA